MSRKKILVIHNISYIVFLLGIIAAIRLLMQGDIFLKAVGAGVGLLGLGLLLWGARVVGANWVCPLCKRRLPKRELNAQLTHCPHCKQALVFAGETPIQQNAAANGTDYAESDY